MANGDIAAAAGLPVVAPTDDIRLGYDEINLTRDEVATHMVSGTHTWGQVTGKPLDSTATAATVPLRDGGATFAVGTPTAGSHPTTKTYVDDLLAALAARVLALEEA